MRGADGRTSRVNAAERPAATLREGMAMTVTPVELFLASPTAEGFRKKLFALEGDFSLTPDDMIDLGNAYFDKYPDSFSDRNLETVHIGYHIARACILEKMLAGVDAKHRPLFRELFENIPRFDELLEGIRRKTGADRLRQYYALISENLENVRKAVDEIPRGMVKERFIGGITKFFNVMYLFKSGIEGQGEVSG